MKPARSFDHSDRDDGIDGLRAVAMTMVVAQHCGLLPFGWTGVWLFYVISGYVIALGFDRPGAQAQPAMTRLGGFWRRRAARLLPAYLAYLLINVLLLMALQRWAPLADLPWLLAFVHNWHMSWPGQTPFSGWAPFGHLWTLSVEQQFYLVFPLLVVALPTRARLVISLGLLLVAPLLRMVWAQSLADQGLREGQVAFGVYAAFHVQFDGFLMGSLLAWWRHQQGHGARSLVLSHGLWRLALAAVALYALAYVAINWQVRGQHGVAALKDVFSGVLRGQHREAWVYSVVSLSCAALLWHVVLGRRGVAWLSAPAWVAVGRASYSGYLVHLLLLWSLGEALGSKVKDLALAPRLLAFAAVWAGTVWVSRLSWRWLEQPAARWLMGQRSTRTTPVRSTGKVEGKHVPDPQIDGA